VSKWTSQFARLRISATAAVIAVLAVPGCAQNAWRTPDNFPTANELAQGVDPHLLGEIQSYTAQINANPRNVAAITNRGVVSLTISRKGPLDVFWLYLAARDLERALQLAPNDFYANHNYAEVCFRYGYTPTDHTPMDLALRFYTNAIEIRPNSARSYMGRSWAHLMLDDEAQFQADSRKALQLDPSLQSDMAKEVAGIRENRRQGRAARDTIRRMASYYIQRSARNAQDCAGYKGYWTNSECRISTALNPVQ
jgi:tetratricopeptide (TPR) repeat protein